MCGIAGVLEGPGRRREELLAQAREMADAIAHRGPDAQGTWADEREGVAFGHRRLSILDLSPTGRQPMHSADGRYVITFNGEMYNYRAVGEELAARGHRFKGTSDTEVVLAAFVEWGIEEALRRFVGMFALALWDRSERRLYLARDRMGEKPLYYGWSGGAFVFGSELKALRRHREWHAEIDCEALTLFFRYNYIPMPYSIFRGISKLVPGTLLAIEPRHVGERMLPAPVAYWSVLEAVEAGRRSPFGGDDTEAVGELDDLLRSSIAGQMISDVPLGAFLSGGIDSSTIVALMQAQSGRRVKTFTVGFHATDYDEARAAKAVADHLGTDHTELYVSPEDARDVIPRLPEHYDEPFADSSQIPTHLIARLARRQVTVSLSGDGGDEVFGGYTRYAWGRLVQRLAQVLPRRINRAVSCVIEGVPPSSWDAVYRCVEPLLPGTLRQRLPGEKLHKLAAVLGVTGSEAIYRRLVSECPMPSALVVSGEEPAYAQRPLVDERLPSGFTERMMFLDMTTYLPDDILVKVDRASMAVSLEARAPFLDHRVVEWAWRLPLRSKNRNGVGKWIVRQLLRRYVPSALVERPKTGFAVPIDTWLRGPLREWAAGLLDEQRLRREGLLHPEPVRHVWGEHLSGRRNLQHHLWAVLMFQAWRERWAA